MPISQPVASTTVLVMGTAVPITAAVRNRPSRRNGVGVQTPATATPTSIDCLAGGSVTEPSQARRTRVRGSKCRMRPPEEGDRSCVHCETEKIGPQGDRDLEGVRKVYVWMVRLDRPQNGQVPEWLYKAIPNERCRCSRRAQSDSTLVAGLPCSIAASTSPGSRTSRSDGFSLYPRPSRIAPTGV